MTLNYLDKQTKQVFDIYVGLDKLITSTTGKVMEAVKKEESLPKTVIILIILVVILVSVNVIILTTKFRRRNLK